jgi:phosphatidylserine/phosphatidylglycerophosphate/cardiolipin synthase-like enzyme
LNQKVIEAHLRGNTVVGIYPLLQDETCYFLAIDFEREAVIVSPFISRRGLLQMLKLMNTALGNKVKVIVLTRPATDYKDQQSIEETLSMLQIDGIKVIYKSNIHQKFAIFDQKIVWYGSINLLSFGRAQESIMRLENLHIANELIRTIGK